jgi:two-component system chemotaxis response regulator CheB
VLSEALKADPAIDVVGYAADGRIGLSKITQVQPDIITLDIEMPGMSGFETLKEIRRLYPKLPVVMFSTLTERGAAATLDALALGASDYVTKPSNTGSLDVTLKRIREELIPKVKALCSRSSGLAVSETKPIVRPPAPRPPTLPRLHSSRVEVLAIGTSTGGPNALSELLPALPRDFPVPIVVVQHMPPLFTRLLAERLDRESEIQIREGVAGGVLDPGQAWIAPGDHHMVVERHDRTVKLGLNQEPPENSCRPAVDVMFRSVSKVYGPATLAVVMTGMGSDGVRGSADVRECGGTVIVQDEASSVVWGMPGQVAASGLADGIVPLAELASEIERRVRSSGASSSGGAIRRQEQGNREPAKNVATRQPAVGSSRAE